MVGKVLKCQSEANLRLSPSLHPRSFHKFDEFLAHLQIFPTLVNIHKFMMNSKNVHASAFKRKQGIHAKTTKRVARRDSQASVNLLFHIKCFHFLEFSAGLKKNSTQSWLQCNQHLCLHKVSLFHLQGLSISLLWSLPCLCCKSSQPPGEVTFSINHRHRKLILSSRERTDTHSLMIDWNPARSGSLTVRKHQSWYSPNTAQKPHERKYFLQRWGVKSGTKPEHGRNWQIPSRQGSRSSTVDTPTWHLSFWLSLFSLSPFLTS